jgi:hypothetical protein
MTDSYHRLAEYTQSIKGSRRLRSGGIFYNRVRRSKPVKADNTCVYCGSRLLFDGYIDDWENCGMIDIFAESRRSNQANQLPSIA